MLFSLRLPSALLPCALLLALAAGGPPARGQAPLADHEGPRRAAARAVLQPPPAVELLVFLRPGGAPARFAGLGLRVRRGLRSRRDAWVLRAASPEAAARALARLRLDPTVEAVYLNPRTDNVRNAFVPNDPFFPENSPPGFPGQWHLKNTQTPGLDARVEGAWNQDFTGLGVTIGIVDDSLQTTHPDLSPNVSAADCFDFGQDDTNPGPVNPDDRHGTSVAGVAAARGGNAVGITGAAPFAKLAGLRIDFPNQTAADFADATMFNSTGGSPTIQVKNHSYGPSIPYAPRPVESPALSASAAAGTVHVFSAGNERGAFAQDSNKKELLANPDSIPVAALGSNGLVASYSNFGANVFVTAPSSSSGFRAVTTTDNVGEGSGFNGGGDPFPNPDYTSGFGGTSSAAPLVAGVVALVRQANPAANPRMVKHLLALTSDVVDPGDSSIQSDGGWKTNGAGFKHNQNYGFGLVDAAGLVNAAQQYTGVTPLQTASTGTVAVNGAIPDDSPAGLTQFINSTVTTPLEEVLVTLNVTHQWRGDVEAFLTSPQGTTSRLMIRSSSDDGTSLAWTFRSNAFWGENPFGQWTLRVTDAFPVLTGTWLSYALQVRMGTLIAKVPGLPDAPTGFAAAPKAGKKQGAKNLTATWTDQAHDETGFEIDVLLDKTGAFLKTVSFGPNTSGGDITGLKKKTAYRLTLRAVNGVGPSPPVGPIVAKTKKK